MLAQVTLTPTESKKFIAKAVAIMDVVKRAAAEGLVVIHPSSSTYFIVEELTGKKPKTQVWVCGVVVPKGACLSYGSSRMDINRPETGPHPPDGFTLSWIVRGNKLVLGQSLRELFEKMGKTIEEIDEKEKQIEAEVAKDRAVLHPKAIESFKEAIETNWGTDVAEKGQYNVVKVKDFGDAKWEVYGIYNGADAEGKVMEADWVVTMEISMGKLQVTQTSLKERRYNDY